MRLGAAFALLTACEAAHPVPISSRAEPAAAPLDPLALTNADRCAMVEAAFRVPELRDFACGKGATETGRVVVDVTMRRTFSSTETCHSAVFSIYRKGQPTNTNAVVRLSIGSFDGATWSFAASYFDPPNSPDDHLADGFDDINYYCALGNGRLEKTRDGWRGWIEPRKPASP